MTLGVDAMFAISLAAQTTIGGLQAANGFAIPTKPLISQDLAEKEGSRTLRPAGAGPRGFEDRGGHRAPSSSVVTSA